MHAAKLMQWAGGVHHVAWLKSPCALHQKRERQCLGLKDADTSVSPTWRFDYTEILLSRDWLVTEITVSCYWIGFMQEQGLGPTNEMRPADFWDALSINHHEPKPGGAKLPREVMHLNLDT